MGGGRINGTVTGSRSLWCGISPGAGFFLPPGAGCICVFGSSFKNGDVSKCSVLSGVCQRGRTPHCSDFQSAAFVRHAAKGGSLPAERSIKKHHRF